MTTIDIRVHGTPAPQGSKTRTRYGLRDDNAERLKPWREAVKHATWDQWGEALDSPPLFTGALNVTVVLIFNRPKGHYGSGRNADKLKPSAPYWMSSKPDLDKCQRSIFDALTDAGVWRDDSQVARVQAFKRYAEPGETAGAKITIEPA